MVNNPLIRPHFMVNNPLIRPRFMVSDPLIRPHFLGVALGQSSAINIAQQYCQLASNISNSSTQMRAHKSFQRIAIGNTG